MGLTEVLLVIAVGGGIIAVLYPTFRGAAVEAGRTADRGEDERATETAELRERRSAVLKALDEIDADLEAGNLSQEDHDRLRSRYEREATALLRELEARPDDRPTAEPSGDVATESPGSRAPVVIGWSAAVIAFVALAGVALTDALSPRAEGGNITGTVPGAESGGSGAGALVPVDEERMAELEKRVAEDSSDVESLVELGHLYLSSQRFDEVAQVSMKALSIDHHNAGALTHLGMVMVAAGQTSDGMLAFNQALQVDPDFAEALLYKGIVSFRDRDFATATESWEHYLEVAPPDANVERVRAMLEAARQAGASEGST